MGKGRKRGRKKGKSTPQPKQGARDARHSLTQASKPISVIPATQTTPQPNMVRRSQAQARALHALGCVKGLLEEDDKERGNYLPYVKALPATIIMSGLGQAMAMEKAGTNDKGHKQLYQHLQSWLCNEDGKGWTSSPYSQQSDLLAAIVGGTQADYIRAQAEAIEYLEWLKKFAVAEMMPAAEPNGKGSHASVS